MSFYEFNANDAYDFARFIGIEAKERNMELHFKTCPYCRPKATRDNINTFAIDLKNGCFKCLRESCGAKGNMITLAKDFNFSLGTQNDEYYAPKKQYRKLKTPTEPIIPKSPAIKFLESRKISEEIAKRYEITVRTDRDNVLVFPFYDELGQLQFIKYRNTEFSKDADNGAKEWCESNCKPILFGMKQCVDFGTIIVTEGQMDSLAVAECGINNAVSVPTGAKGFTWVPYCWDWLKRFETIIVFGDYEKGHISLLDEFARRFKNVKHVREIDYKDCKDANEILIKYGKEQVQKCVDNAIEMPINNVVCLSDVQNVDIFKIPKLPTGIKQADSLLYGGLPFGYVHIIAGKRGDGKSTFASQIIDSALDNNYKCFIYSGELTNSNFKAWLDYQLAGRKNIIETTGAFGSPHWFITNTNSEKITEWYRDKCYIYDNSMVDDEDEDLIKTIEETICKYGVKVVLIDNLMTAMSVDADNTDKYEKQSRFVKKLTKIALNYQVIVLLVAHRRKNSFTTDANDEISGSADITNLAGIVMSYDRDKDYENEFDRKLIISKNRLFGKLNYEGYQLHFDEKSKRIYGSGDDVDRHYGWESTKDGFYQSDFEDNPFC